MRNTRDNHHQSTPSAAARTAGETSVRKRFGLTSGIAVAIVAGGVFAATTSSAAPVDGESTFVPITPCRLFDTRPGPEQVGPRSTPIGEAQLMTQQVTGTNGDCTIPPDATAVALNATHDNATGNSFVTFFPADTVLPLSSNLNFLPGQAPTPNKVDVKLSSDGAIKIYNNRGEVDMIADVAGYYTDSSLTETRQAITGLETGLAGLGTELAGLGTELDDLRDEVGFSPSPIVVSAHTDGQPIVGTDTVLEVDIVVPGAGSLVASSSARMYTDVEGLKAECSITMGNSVESVHSQAYQATGSEIGYHGQLSGTRHFPVNLAGVRTVKLICDSDVSFDMSIQGADLTVMYVPAP